MSADKLRDWARGLAEGVHLDDLKEVLARIEETAGEGRAEAEVWTAVELDPNERQTIESRLRGAHGDDLEIAYHVEPDLIGGVIVRVGDRYLDASVASKLGQLRQDLVTGRVG